MPVVVLVVVIVEVFVLVVEEALVVVVVVAYIVGMLSHSPLTRKATAATIIEVDPLLRPLLVAPFTNVGAQICE